MKNISLISDKNPGISFSKKHAIILLDKEQAILERIKKHYGSKLNRSINDEEAKEIAGNLLNFAKAIYGA